MKKCVQILIKIIPGILTGVCLAAAVSLLTDYNFLLLLGVFIVLYFLVGIGAEYAEGFFASVLTRSEKESSVMPDEEEGKKYADRANVKFITDSESLAQTGEDKK